MEEVGHPAAGVEAVAVGVGNKTLIFSIKYPIDLKLNLALEIVKQNIVKLQILMLNSN